MSDNHSSRQLVRALGLGFAISVTIANILGSGVYKKVAPMADTLQSPGWVLVAWVLGGLITLFGALSIAEVAGMLADTGGEYAYYKKIYNRKWAFSYGWAMFIVVQSASISSLSYVFSQSLHAVVPFPQVLTNLKDVNLFGIFYPFADLNIKLVGIAMIILLTLFNTRGIKTGAWLSSAILAFVYVGIGIIVVFGLTSGKADISQAFDFSLPEGHSITISAMFTAMLAAFWAYQGWNSLGYMGGEVKDPGRNVPRGITIGVGIIIFIYLLVNVAYLSLLNIDALKAVNASGDQIAAVEAVKAFWGNGGAIFIGVLIFITTLGCTHATIYGSARAYFAMAREGLFFKNTDKLNEHHAPSKVLWIQCLWACLLVFSGSFDQLTDMTVFAFFFFFALTTIGVFVLRRTMPDAHRPYKVWGYPVVPAVFIIFCIVLIINTIMTQPREAIFGLILLATGIPAYLYFTKTNKGSTKG